MSTCEGRPATGAPAENLTTHRLNLSTKDSATWGRVTPLPLAWAKALVEAGGEDVPEYASPTWAALNDRSPVKVAACVQAAERWRTRRHQVDYLETTSSRRAQEITAARRARPGDHQGGPVPWDREQAVPGD